MAEKNESSIPTEVNFNGLTASEGSQVNLLGYGNLEWEKTVDGMRISIPENVVHNPPCKDAWTFKFKIK